MLNNKVTQRNGGISMLPKSEIEAVVKQTAKKEGGNNWDSMYEQSIADLMADPRLTNEERQQVLNELELPDEEWEPIRLPEGAEPISDTLIKMRRGEGNILRGQLEG